MTSHQRSWLQTWGWPRCGCWCWCCRGSWRTRAAWSGWAKGTAKAGRVSYTLILSVKKFCLWVFGYGSPFHVQKTLLTYSQNLYCYYSFTLKGNLVMAAHIMSNKSTLITNVKKHHLLLYLYTERCLKGQSKRSSENDFLWNAMKRDERFETHEKGGRINCRCRY